MVWQPGECAWMTVGLDGAGLSLSRVLATDYGTFRPLFVLAGGVEWRLLGANANAHHLVLLALHLCNVALLGWLARRLGLSLSRALACALLFALGPLRLDVALSLHARGDLLVTALCLGFALLWWTGAPSRGRMLVALATATLACLSKETALAAVPAMAILDGRWSWRARVAPLVVVACVLVARTIAIGATGSYLDDSWHLAPGLRGIAESALLAVAPSAALIAWADRARAALGAGVYAWVRGGVCLVVALLAVAYVGRALPRSPTRTVGVALALSGLAVGVAFINAREVYFPATGVCLLLAACPWRRAQVLLGGLIALLAVATIARAAEHVRVERLGRALHENAIAMARAHHVNTLVIIAAPDEIEGVGASPASECWRLARPEETELLPLVRSSSRRGLGPILLASEAHRVTLAFAPGEWEVAPFVCVAPGVRCSGDTITVELPTVAATGYALWMGGDGLRWLE